MKWRNSDSPGGARPAHPYDWEDELFPTTMRRSGTQIAAAIGTCLLVLVILAGIAAVVGANNLDCRPVITGPYQDYDGTAAVTLTRPDYCALPEQVRLVVFALPAGVTGLTSEAADVDQTPVAIVDATLQPGVPHTLDPSVLHGCGDLQIDLAPNNEDWAQLEVGVPAPHNLPGAYTASAEHADDQCHPCQFAVPAPDVAPSVSERHDDAPCGVGAPQSGAPSGTTGPVSGPVLSAANNTTPTTPPVGVASSAAETTIAPSTVVSAAAATTLPNTGIDVRWFLLAGIVLAVAGMVLILVGPHIFRNKGRRS